jgi:hypothetical protein
MKEIREKLTSIAACFLALDAAFLALCGMAVFAKITCTFMFAAGCVK